MLSSSELAREQANSILVHLQSDPDFLSRLKQDPAATLLSAWPGQEDPYERQDSHSLFTSEIECECTCINTNPGCLSTVV